MHSRVTTTATGLIVASLSLLTLSACSTDPASCVDGLPGTGLASTIVVSGDFDAVPTEASFPTPLVADEASVAIASEGDGPLVRKGQVVAGNVTLFDGASGQPFNGGAITLPTAEDSLPMLDAAICAPVGSRVVAAGPAVEILGDYTTNFDVADDDTIVMTLDIDGAYLSRAEGTPVLPQNGLPTVSLAPDGRPGVSFTGSPAPTELRSETLIKGSGETVEEGDTLLVHYTGIDFDTRKVFDSTWESGRPAQLAFDGLVPGFKTAVLGATVGSQILAVVPPSEGYGDNPPSGLSADSTMLFVIDILGIIPGSADSGQ